MDPIIQRLVVLRELCDLGLMDLAAATGTSPSTIERSLARQALPESLTPRRAIVAFVERNSTATRRSEVRFVERGGGR